MRKVVLWFAVLLITFGCSTNTPKDSPIVETDLPTMPITLVNSTRIDTKSLTGNIVLVFFQPDCDHCQREAQVIQKNITHFKSYSMYFISSAPLPQIDQFAREYQLANLPHVYFGATTSDYVLSNFGPIETPSIYIYNASGKLAKSFNGETAIEEIVKHL